MAFAKTINLEDFGKELQKIPKEVQKSAINSVYDEALKALQDLVEKTPVDTGLLASSWEVVKNPLEQEPSVVMGNFQNYAVVVLESGAKPFTPNFKPLHEWAARKLKKPMEDPEVKRLAWGTFRKIQREGITAKFIFSDFLDDILVPRIRDRIYADLNKDKPGGA